MKSRFLLNEIPTKVVNLGGMVADAMLDDTGIDPIFEDLYSSRKRHRNIAIEVYSYLEKDCLQVDPFRGKRF